MRQPAVGLLQIEPLKKPAKCCTAHFNNLLFRFRPTKHILFKTLHPDTETIVSPVQDLDYIPFPVAECKITPREKIKFKLFLHHQRQTVYGFTHIRGAKSNKHPHCSFATVNHNCSRVAITFFRTVEEKLFLICTWNCLDPTISTRPASTEVVGTAGRVNG